MTRSLNHARKIPVSDRCALASLRASTSHELRHELSQFIHVPDLSYGHPVRGCLIQGDNIPALHELRGVLEGRVRCIYIDPPYNNQEKYRHYVDSQRHGLWIEKLGAQLTALKPLLAQNGSLWISIDDTELHYLKVAADHIMGRRNFITTIVWQHRKTRENRKVFSNNHEYLLLYARDPKAFRASRNLLPATDDLLSRYRNPDCDPRGPWQSVSANVQDGHATPTQHYRIIAPNGKVHYPPEGRCWIYTESRMKSEIEAGNIWFGRGGGGVPRIKRFLDEGAIGLTPETLWTSDEVGTSNGAKKQLLDLFPNEAVFDTPKPESLVARVIEIATDPGDIVLDAFLGSGTTAAVAHKLGRAYVGIESGEQARTHCAQRLRLVVEGDRTGVSEEKGWAGGGGFDFFEHKAP